MRHFFSLAIALLLAATLFPPGESARAQGVTTTKRAGWIQSCVEDRQGKVLHCRLVRRVALKGGAGRGRQVSLQIRRSRMDKPFIRIQVPSDVDLRSGVSLAVMDGKSSLSTLAYRSSLENCNETVCIARLPLDEELLTALKTNKLVLIGFADTDDEKVSVAVPLRNFERAYDGLDVALK